MLRAAKKKQAAPSTKSLSVCKIPCLYGFKKTQERGAVLWRLQSQCGLCWSPVRRGTKITGMQTRTKLKCLV